MVKTAKQKNIFADKATLIPRMMLVDPQKKWVVRDFTGPQGVSLGMAQEVLAAMDNRGYVERLRRGPASHTILTNPAQLISDWTHEYKFELNQTRTYFSSDRHILEKIKDYCKEDRYALTLHTGANLLTSFVKTDDIFLYLHCKDWHKELLEMRQRLDLKELVRGGNVHLIYPFYKNSIFFNAQKIKGFSVVSSLQLYLDLYHFQPRGREHAEFLKGSLEGKGRRLD